MSLLEVNGLNAYYGDSHILFDVSLRVEKHEAVALVGRNGAGKSTTLKSLMGVVARRTGSIKLDGVELVGERAHSIASLGMQLVHEDRRIFGSLSVEENIVLAGLTAKAKWPLERIYGMFPRLKERRTSRGTDLSGGEQQMLAIARALVRDPKIILLGRALRGPRADHRPGPGAHLPGAGAKRADHRARRTEPGRDACSGGACLHREQRPCRP